MSGKRKFKKNWLVVYLCVCEIHFQVVRIILETDIKFSVTFIMPEMFTVLESRKYATVSYTHLDVYKRQVHVLPTRPPGG